MDEGLLFVLIVPTFIIILPIVISSFILYFILRNKKMSIIGSIIGFIGTIIVGYIFGLIWYATQIFAQIFEGSRLDMFLIPIVSGMLTAFMGLIIIKIFQRLKTIFNMKVSKMIVGVGILIIIILIVKSIAIPFYFMSSANINVVKYDSCDNAINVTTEELKEDPTIEKVINGEGCSENGALCIITNEEWSKTKNFIYNKIANSSQGCFKFGEHDGFYSLAFNRP